MQSHFSPREMYPHRDLGIVLLVVGVLLMVFAVAIGGTCVTVNQGGLFPGGGGSYCDYPYAGGAVALGVLGFIFLIISLVLVMTRNPATIQPTTYFAPAWYPNYAPPPPPPSPAPLLIACKSCGRVYHVGQHGFCPNCGTKLGN